MCNQAYKPKGVYTFLGVLKIKILVTYLIPQLRMKYGGKDQIIEVDREDITLKDLIDIVSKKHSELIRQIFTGSSPSSGYIILVNGRSIKELDMRLKDGDRVIFLQAAGGG